MVNLTRIWTGTGDDGTTALGDFSRTRKTDARLVAYADVDEANSALGVALTGLDAGGEPLGEAAVAVLTRVQNDLFDVGADLCNPLAAQHEYPPLRVREAWVHELEEACDTFNDELPKLRSFVLPSGTATSARLHVARTVTRRAERSAWAALEAYGDAEDGGVNPLTATYLNRLSDLLFVMARYANRAVGDVLWVPGGGREAPSGQDGPDDTAQA